MQIVYQEVNDALLEKIAAHYGNEEMIRSHLHFESGSISLVALDGEIPVGFISAYTESLTMPLSGEKDACIAIIEVDEQYRRQGIGKKLVELTEEWASKNGFPQIRAWSSQDKTEAIPMWRKLGYCMCPATIWIEWCKEAVDGYYVVKKLNNK